MNSDFRLNGTILAAKTRSRLSGIHCTTTYTTLANEQTTTIPVFHTELIKTTRESVCEMHFEVSSVLNYA